MIKIKSIKKLRGNRYSIEIAENDTVEKHILNENTLIKHSLLSTKELTKEEYKNIVKDNEYETLYLKAIHFISYQMRSISEVKKHLRKDTKNEALINKIIKELKDNRYVDDIHFVTEFVNQKLEYDLVGPRYIKEKLIGKGIHFDLIADALLQYNSDLEFSKIDEIIKNETKYKINKPYQKAYLSIKQKLINKGFSLNIVESSLISHKDDIKEMIDENHLLQKEISKIIDKYDLNDYEQKNKLIKKLMTKGYNYEVIKKHLK